MHEMNHSTTIYVHHDGAVVAVNTLADSKLIGQLVDCRPARLEHMEDNFWRITADHHIAGNPRKAYGTSPTDAVINLIRSYGGDSTTYIGDTQADVDAFLAAE
jgi:hypothetical protein